MFQKIHKYINGRFILFYEDKSGLIFYPNNSIGFYLWNFVHDKEEDKTIHFNNLQLFLNND